MNTTTVPDYTYYDHVLLSIERDPDKLSRPCVENDGTMPTAGIIRLLLGRAETLDNGPPGSLGCAGLAANQIGINARVIVVKISGRFKAFASPVILGRFGAKYTALETCFSFPGQQRVAVRYPEIMVKAQGMPVPKKLRGHEAQAFQHEVDHLNGVLI